MLNRQPHPDQLVLDLSKDAELERIIEACGGEALDYPKSKEFKETIETIKKSGKAKFVGFSCHHRNKVDYLTAAAEGGPPVSPARQTPRPGRPAEETAGGSDRLPVRARSAAAGCGPSA